MKKKLVILTGAGISAESGFATFRDSGGLWETHPVEAVATPEGWYRNPDFVNEFYNGLRHQLIDAKPNRAHEILAELEKDYDVTIITQNVDDLHDRAGSTKVIYLHGELMKACSSDDPNDTRYIQTLNREHLDINPGDKAGDGSLLRPYIVWFGEAVPNIEPAAEECQKADIFVIIGTSMVVYPAAGLIHYCRRDIPVYLIDPNEVQTPASYNVTVIQNVATKGCEILAEKLKNEK